MIAVRWPCDNPIYWVVQPEVATAATSSAEHEPSIFERHEQGGPLDRNAHVHGAVIMNSVGYALYSTIIPAGRAHYGRYANEWPNKS